MFPQVLLEVFLCCIIAKCYGAVIEIDMVISRGIVDPDGYKRIGYLVNGKFPGPTIYATVGDQLVVKVTNMQFPHEANVIHFHGIHQEGTPWYDGAAFVTNCPVVYATPFVLNFTVSHAGTFWYHSHLGSSRMEGTYGALVVQSPQTEPFEYDNEIPVIFADWYHKSVSDIETGLASNPFVWPLNGNSVLVEGKGDCLECPYRYPSNIPVDFTNCLGKRKNFLVEPGKKYLLRLINAASMAYFNFAIAGHNLTVVGADASFTQQRELQSVEVGPGQRLSVLVATDQHAAPLSSDELFTYMIRVQTEWRGNDTSHAGIGYAHWTYASSSTISKAEANGAEDTTINEDVSDVPPPNESREWDEWNQVLRQYDSTGFPSPSNDEVTRTVLMDVQQQFVSKATGQGFSPPLSSPETANTMLGWTLVNNSIQKMSSTPHLLERYFDTTVDEKTYDNDGTPPIRIELGSVVDIVIQNSVAINGVCEQHPWHLHGHDFYVVGQGSGKFDPQTSPSSYNLTAAPLVDTVVGYPSRYANRRSDPLPHEKGTWMEPCGWITLRFTANNPGKQSAYDIQSPFIKC
jgi:L-ascorbate oxidase